MSTSSGGTVIQIQARQIHIQPANVSNGQSIASPSLQQQQQQANPPGIVEDAVTPFTPPSPAQPSPQPTHTGTTITILQQKRPQPITTTSIQPNQIAPNPPSQPQQFLQQPNGQPQQQLQINITQPMPQKGEVMHEESLSGSYYSDEEEGESSEDESPRENRVLTFADEHGKALVNLHWYEPDPGEDHRGGVTNTNNSTDDAQVEGGCGKCVIL